MQIQINPQELQTIAEELQTEQQYLQAVSEDMKTTAEKLHQATGFFNEELEAIYHILLQHADDVKHQGYVLEELIKYVQNVREVMNISEINLTDKIRNISKVD